MAIKRNKKGQFDKGNASGKMFTIESSLGNQHAKGNPKNRTTWNKGDTAMDKHPQWKGGVQHIRNDCVYVTVAPNVRVRRPLLVYESVYGKLPKGYIIIHKDGDRYNDDIDNLEAITRAELLVRNRKD
jgi:hypothetical protein